MQEFILLRKIDTYVNLITPKWNTKLIDDYTALRFQIPKLIVCSHLSKKKNRYFSLYFINLSMKFILFFCFQDFLNRKEICILIINKSFLIERNIIVWFLSKDSSNQSIVLEDIFLFSCSIHTNSNSFLETERILYWTSPSKCFTGNLFVIHESRITWFQE